MSSDTRVNNFLDPHARPRVSRSWIARYGLSYLGINIAWAAPSQLLIAKQVLNFYGDGQKEKYFALIMAIGGVVSIIATPLWGYLSDWTRSRFGRRAPWIFLGSLIPALCLVWLGSAPNFAQMILAWAIFQIVIAAAVGACQAVAPDTVPTQQYGLVSGVLGLTYTLAVVLGTAIGTLFSLTPAYWVTAAATMLLVIQFLLHFRDVPTGSEVLAFACINKDKDEATAASCQPVGAQAQAAHPYADFRWVFIARLVVTLGNVTALFYLFYYLRDKIKLADPDLGVLILTGIYAVAVLIFAVVSGLLSDRLQKRRIFVAAASAGVAIACLIMAFAAQFVLVIIAALVLGISWGTYMAVDQALINEVLPIPANRGRDIGIMNIAVVTPNALAPVFAAASLQYLGGYAGLYILSGSLALLGAILIYKVRHVA